MIDFVPIGDSGNPADTSARPAEASGSVIYVYRMRVFETRRNIVTKAITDSELGVGLEDVPFFEGVMRPETSAMRVSWNEAARSVNWLNESKRFARVYKFDLHPGDAG